MLRYDGSFLTSENFMKILNLVQNIPVLNTSKCLLTKGLKFFYSGYSGKCMYNLYNFEPKQGFLENFRMSV